MKSQITARLSVRVLMAATVLGAGLGGAGAWADDASSATLEASDVLQPAPGENGVHAVPSVAVTEAVLPSRAARVAPPAPARLTLAAVTDAPPAPPPAAEPSEANPLPAQLSDDIRPSPPAAAPPVPALSPVPAEAQLRFASNEAATQPAATPASYDSPPMRQRVAFPRHSAEAAVVFNRYMHTASGIGADFRSGEAVGSALQSGAGYNAAQLEEGMIAYGAIAALQEPRFVYGLMDLAQDERTRQALIDALLADPSVVLRLKGAEAAGAMASAAIARQADPVVSAGKALKQASYDVQHQDWSKANVADAVERLSRAKAASASAGAAEDGDVGRLIAQIASLPAPRDAGGAPTGVTERSLALAALSILDGTQGEDPARLDKVITESVSAQCLKMAKLNLFQCLSVAGPQYEDVYCLGQHAVLDTGQCVAAAATPARTIMLTAALPEDRAQVMIPVAAVSRPPEPTAADER